MIFLYINVMTFNSFSSTIIIDLWLPKTNSVEENEQTAGKMMGIPYLLGSFLFPLFGLFYDSFGKRVYFLLLSTVLLLIAFIILPFVYPIATFALLGLSYAMFGSVIWPTVAYIVPKKKIV
jgi:MFS family permease